ncbi:LysR substrate-binding domain-containing protein [Paraburkholderia rhizosphaerae]|uniref:DNA-binding transcriptional LysR family regulator n=1 Tax=Paraburkholderia rhizosphaerae TaxID=480658 RepID=A0A4R8LLD0_9BURK|nr:LysR substrate-binding domain-containing protein [Paraburkholderia rhizosphaerae]TDY45403.1 DNA-binding transcriptional LysR family regulator [Paraburkholderia rhizosphaerae]
MPLRLPPLSSLRFFEAAARHLSFKLAAAELHVTPSAVSHGIVGLEQALGVELFVREPRGLSLTPEGKQYLPYISEAFALIAIGTQRLPDRRADRTIAVSCAPTLAMRWFVPRLARFRDSWPNVNVTVDTSRRLMGFPADGFDFALRLSRGPVAGASCDRLFGERLVPVCSPTYLDTWIAASGTGSSDGSPDAKPDLRRATLIHVDTASADWQAWLDGAGYSGIDAAGGLHFDTVQLALEAAAGGLGVAIGRLPLADADLAARTLVAASDRIVDAEPAYWLIGAHGADARPDLLAFRQWLLAEAALIEPVARAVE